jgi:pSer/pThr/pTyr-binding forkhead associated (FHA) protein
MPRLIVLQNNRTAKQLSLNKLPFLMGRGLTCDLVLDNPQVSRAHAVFEQADDGVCIRDLGGANGTQVNGQRMPIVNLGNGDEIKIGACLIRYLASGGDTLSDAEALRLVTVPGKLEELELRKLAPPPPRP